MILNVEALEKIYRSAGSETRALLPTSFALRSGEFVSLVGPSGCGKTTCLYMVAGLERPSAGRVLMRGEPIIGPGRDRGMVCQHYNLFPWLTVKDNIRFSRQLRANLGEHTSAQVEAALGRADALLHLMGLEAFAQAYPKELSGGMKQRVAIARALLPRPSLLLMDEPFGALDSQTREEMQDLVLQLNRHEQTTTLFVTHDVEEAIYLSTRVLVFSPRPGRIIEDIAVPFSAERLPELKLAPEFLTLKRRIVDLLRHAAKDDREALMRRLIQ